MNRLTRDAYLVWFCVACFLCARPADAEESRITKSHVTVVLISPLGEDCDVCETANRKLALEIGNRLKWIVISASRSSVIEEELDTLMERHLRESRADAAVLILKPKKEEAATAAVLVMDYTEMTLHFRAVDIPLSDMDDAAEAAAIRIADTLQAAMFPVLGPETPIAQSSDVEAARDAKGIEGSTEVQPDPDTPKFVRVRLSTAMIGMYSPGDTGPRGGPTVGVYFLPIRRMSVGLSATFPVLAADISRNNTVASLNVVLARIQTAYEGMLHRRLTTSLGLSLGAGYLRVTGQSSPDFRPQTDQSLLLYIGGFGELHLILNRRLSIPVGFVVGSMPPGVTIRFPENTAFRFGTAVFEIGGGLEVHL